MNTYLFEEDKDSARLANVTFLVHQLSNDTLLWGPYDGLHFHTLNTAHFVRTAAHNRNGVELTQLMLDPCLPHRPP
jgi:hypothetical protein